MAPTRPSIMSLGAITSQPALACVTACLHSTARVSSFTTSPSTNKPSWPWDVNGSSATSQMTPMLVVAAFTARTARQTKLSGLKLSSPPGVFLSAGVTGKTAMAGMPRASASCAAATSDAIECRWTPGMLGIGASGPSPS